MRFSAALLAVAAACLLCACGAEDSGPGDDEASPDAGTEPLPFMSECTLGEDEQCETGLCYNFNMKGPHCTHACEVDADCEAPSPGCNGMGVCKAPDGDGSGGGGGDGGG
jgi:hypothetical protein